MAHADSLARGPEAEHCFWAAALYDGRNWHGGEGAPGCRVRVATSGQIVAIERGEPAAGDRCYGTLLPGFVDAHVHLELGPLSRPAGSFVDWLRAVIATRRDPAAPDPAVVATQNLREAQGSGYASFCEIDSLGAGARALAAQGLRARVDLELLGFDLSRDAARLLVRERLLHAPAGLSVGLGPHAPYSVGAELFRAALERGPRLSVHVAESPEELEFLQRGSGPFRELLADLGRLPLRWQAPGLPPIEYLDRLGVLGPRTLLVHAQHATEAELDLVARRGAAIVLCPGTIRYFDRPAPALAAMRQRGIPVAFGTDSRASNERLDPRHELRLAHELFGDVPAQELLAMATSAAGVAIGEPAGMLQPGRSFDALAEDEVAPVAEGPEAASRWWIARDEPFAESWIVAR